MNRPDGRAALVLGLVESPAQLLHLIEWCYSRGLGAETEVAILQPRDEATRRQLRVLADFAAEEHVAVSWYSPRESRGAGLRTLTELRRRVAAATTLVIGDPFSGVIQVLLLASPAREVVVVDDGTATFEFTNLLAHGGPLLRWDEVRSSFWRTPLGERARATLQARGARLFTAMPVTGVPARRVQANHYDWTRGRFGPVRVRPGLDLIGSSLVETGVIEAEPYLAAVGRLAAAEPGRVRYFAHRRESREKLAALGRRCGVEVVRPDVPLEVELCRDTVASRVAGFPSSVGFTLPRVLAGSGVRIETQPLPAEMFAAGASRRAREFLEQVGDDLRRLAAGPTRSAAPELATSA